MIVKAIIHEPILDGFIVSDQQLLLLESSCARSSISSHNNLSMKILEQLPILKGIVITH